MKIKKWKLWTAVGVTLALAVGLIWWNLYATNKTLVTILLVIDFIILTFSLQMAISQTFKFKPKPKKFISASFDLTLEDLENNLKQASYKKRNMRYGYSYMKIQDKVAYKVTFVNDPEEYLKPIEGKEEGNVPGLDNCKKFIGFEIFVDYNDKILDRLTDFSFQGKNIYYEGYYIAKEDNKLIEANIIEAAPDFLDLVNNLKSDLGAVKDVDE